MSIVLNEKSCMCFEDLGNSFGRVPMKVLKWGMRKK